MRRLVLLDRDGTINVERHYLSSPSQVELLPGSIEGLRRIRELGLPAVVLTNQSAIARGTLKPETLHEIHDRLNSLLDEHGLRPEAIYVCPHLPDDKCLCRKPEPGLAQRAAADFGADLSSSFVIGDNVCDIELGRRIGATAILVRTGYGAQVLSETSTVPDYVVEDLTEAAKLIETIVIDRRPELS